MLQYFTGGMILTNMCLRKRWVGEMQLMHPAAAAAAAAHGSMNWESTTKTAGKAERDQEERLLLPPPLMPPLMLLMMLLAILQPLLPQFGYKPGAPPSNWQSRCVLLPDELRRCR